ncbi:MAG: transposase, partial [Candidatus Schekmanbacteria bacterium]|nr:transposase [Candidatus Schekmanbacteria bacterium]
MNRCKSARRVEWGHHPGENLDKVLAQRREELPPPIQMNDAGSCNSSPAGIETIVANCMAHARRHFVDVATSFPDEVRHVLEVLREVYRYDDEAKAARMSPAQRLTYHRENSKPLMEGLK